ncbi:long-chain-fatty-acid--CoA ligase [Streptomyces sp. NPDC051985]|uniref:long-chain-fatty-acid--CoA ligase n=1 Tax=Streptomyces sp. NPDC051985 TaxID=3155807 RepID=UPI0034361E36
MADVLTGLESRNRCGGGSHWVDHVARNAHADPHGVALRFEGKSTSWAELHHRIEVLATALADRGVDEGDRVAILMTNRPEFIESVLAANLLGAIAVPVNFRLSAPEIAYILSDSGSRVLITDAGLAELAQAARGGAEELPCVVTGIATGGPGTESYEELLRTTTASPPDRAVTESQPALIMYTSGTTGRPKGATLTHLNLLVQTLITIRSNRLFEDDEVYLITTPLFHIGALGAVTPLLLVGGTIVIMPSTRFDPGSMLDVIEAEGVHHIFLVPTQWAQLCAQDNASVKARTLRTGSWAAAPASVTLLERMSATFPGIRIIAAFGQTEMSPVTCVLDAKDAIRKIGSVGRPAPLVAMRVVDDHMNDVPQGEVGEIVYRGPGTMAGYWNSPEATAEAMEGGWFHSGDLVRVDEEGFVYVVDRKKDMIISGGENIYCAEVENALAAHPAVADVAVIGRKHPRWGETPVAVIVPDSIAPTLAELTEWCRARLASFKRPTDVVLVEALPRNASGKVLKHELRVRYGADQSSD